MDIEPDSLEPKPRRPYRPEDDREVRTYESSEVPAWAFLIAVGGVGVILSGVAFPACQGASRTARLEWQRRQVEIELAINRPAPEAPAAAAADDPAQP